MVTVPSVVKVVHSRFLCTDAGSDLSQLTLLAPQALTGSRVASRAVDSEFVSKHGASSILVVCRHTKQTITVLRGLFRPQVQRRITLSLHTVA